jgi:hypothetical protein
MTTKAVSDTLKAFFVSGPIRGKVKGVWLSALEKWGSTEARKLAGGTPIFSVKGAAALEPLLADKPISGPASLSIPYTPAPVASAVSGRPGILSMPSQTPGPQTVEAKIATRPLPTAPPAPVNAAAQNNPATPGLSRFACLKALDALDIKVRGSESDATLNLMVEAERANWRARQISYDEAMKSCALEVQSHPEPVGPWDCDNLGAMIESVFGKGTVRQIVSHASEYNVGPGSTAHEMAGLPPHSRAYAVLAEKARTELRVAMVSPDSPKERARRFDAMRAFIASTGCEVPGLDLSGCSAELALEAQQKPRQMEAAQRAINSFTGVLTGCPVAGRNQGRYAADARAFVSSQTRKPYTIGMVGKREFPANIVNPTRALKV